MSTKQTKIKAIPRGGAARGNSTQVICVRLLPEHLEKLDRIARKQGVNRSSVLVHAINTLNL